MGNAGKTQSPPPQGAVLGLLPRSYHHYIGQKGTCLLSKLGMYHLVLKIPPHVPDIVKSINNDNKDNIRTQIPTSTLPGKTLVLNKLVNSQAKQPIPTNKIASKQQEQFDALQGNQVSQSYTPFSPL